MSLVRFPLKPAWLRCLVSRRNTVVLWASSPDFFSHCTLSGNSSSASPLALLLIGRSLLLCVSQNLAYYLGTVLSDPRLTVLGLTHIGHSEPNSLRRLACGVFDQALRDCGFLSSARIDRKVQKEAIAFLTSGGEAFRFWCKALDQNPDIVQSEKKSGELAHKTSDCWDRKS